MFWTVYKFELAYWFKRPLSLLFFAPLPRDAGAEISGRRERAQHEPLPAGD